MYGFMDASTHSCACVCVCCGRLRLTLKASVQFEVDEGVSRCQAAQAVAAVHRAVMGGIYYWRAPLTPLLSSAVVICVCAAYLHSLLILSSVPLLYLQYLPVCYSVSFVIHTHTHTHLTQQFISVPNLCSERENEFRRSVVSLHGCAYRYLYIDLASPLLLHSSRYRLVFSAGICA